MPAVRCEQGVGPLIQFVVGQYQQHNGSCEAGEKDCGGREGETFQLPGFLRSDDPEVLVAAVLI